MAKGKKTKAPKKPKAPPPGTPKRPTGEETSPIDPSHVMPTRSLSYTDFPVKGQKKIEQSMAEAGKSVYGSPIKMADAVATRVSSLESAIARSSTGVPAGVGWYREHQQGYLDVARRTGAQAGRVIDVGAQLSIRNAPEQERKAAESAAFIAMNPQHKVTITPEMAPHMGSEDYPAGDYELGGMPHETAAHIGYAETQALKSLGHVNKQGNVLPSARFTPRSVTDVTLRSAGRDVATSAIEIARGGSLKYSTTAPKITNYARGTHTASEAEDRYNTEVLLRRAHTPRHIDPQTGQTWQQGHLWSASEATGFDPSQAGNETVEDYVMNAMTAEVAAKKGNTGKTAREAQDIVMPKKGRNTFDVSVTPEEIRHSFNEEATKRAAASIGHTSLTPDGDIHETITPRAAQAIAWTESRRHTLNEDAAFNRQQRDAEKAAKAADKASAKKAKEDAKAQLTIPGL